MILFRDHSIARGGGCPPKFMSASIRWLSDDVAAALRESPLRLRAEAFDAGGVLVDSIEGSAEVVVDMIVKFVVLHGVDPDERGNGASRGSVRFGPA